MKVHDGLPPFCDTALAKKFLFNRLRLKILWFEQWRDFEPATFQAQHAHQLHEHLVLLWLNEGEGWQMALNGNGRVWERRHPICLIGFGVDANMQQGFVTGLGWREKREDLDLTPILPAFPIHGNIEGAIAIFPDQDLPVQVARFMDEIRAFLNARGFLRHLMICLSEKYTSLHHTQSMR